MARPVISLEKKKEICDRLWDRSSDKAQQHVFYTLRYQQLSALNHVLAPVIEWVKIGNDVALWYRKWWYLAQAE